ncbi:putative transcription factor C2H2 family [Arabidopsis thaliana]
MQRPQQDSPRPSFVRNIIVTRIDYIKQQISINDPEDCFVKRLLTFNTSGSPFSPRFSLQYTFLTCPNEIVKRVAVPVNLLFENDEFATLINYVDVLLEWSSPNCRGCEMDSLRCGFKNKASLEVKCFADKSGHLSSRLRVRLLIITLVIIGGITATCLAIRIYNSERFVNQRRQNAAITARNTTQQPRGVVVTTGLDQSTIESYKKVELGESRRLPGTNGIICPICLSEYASKETVRCMPECDHCFHVQCIDEWLKIHSSCPVCRNSRS